MNDLRKWVPLLILVGAPLAGADDFDQFVQLKKVDILDPSISSETVNRMLQEGITSSDPNIEKLTLESISHLTQALVVEVKVAKLSTLPLQSRDITLPSRKLNEVPGLKDFLINHWNIQHERSGFDAQGQLESDLKQLVGVNLGANVTDDTRDNWNDDSKLEAIVKSIQDHVSPWITIPQTLAIFWPNDDDVHRFIWEFHENDRTIEPMYMLRLLNYGRFTTEQANKYRMNRLIAFKVEAGPHADIEISLAARGLALSLPEDAIPNLIRAGLDHIDPRADVLITLAGYSDDQLDPYYERLVPLATVPARSLPSSNEVRQALSRLVPYAMNSRKIWKSSNINND